MKDKHKTKDYQSSQYYQQCRSGNLCIQKHESSNFLDPKPWELAIVLGLRRSGKGLPPSSLGLFSKQHKRPERGRRRNPSKEITISVMEIPQSSLKPNLFLIWEQLLVYRDCEIKLVMIHICYEHLVYRC